MGGRRAGWAEEGVELEQTAVITVQAVIREGQLERTRGRTLGLR